MEMVDGNKVINGSSFMLALYHNSGSKIYSPLRSAGQELRHVSKVFYRLARRAQEARISKDKPEWLLLRVTCSVTLADKLRMFACT